MIRDHALMIHCEKYDNKFIHRYEFFLIKNRLIVLFITQRFIFVNYMMLMYVIYRSKNTSLKMKTTGGRNM